MDLFYNSRDTREQIFQNIAAFIEEAYADPLKDAGCALMEAGFQKKIKKKGISVLSAAMYMRGIPCQKTMSAQSVSMA